MAPQVGFAIWSVVEQEDPGLFAIAYGMSITLFIVALCLLFSDYLDVLTSESKFENSKEFNTMNDTCINFGRPFLWDESKSEIKSSNGMAEDLKGVRSDC